MKSPDVNQFEYHFRGIKEDLEFYLSANNVRSRGYKIHVLEVPKLLNFQMNLDYPKYLQRKSDTIQGTGNVRIPEGTKVSWKLSTESTEEVSFVIRDSTIQFERANTNFSLTKPVYANFDYRVNTSNSLVKNYEALEYSISVIKDQFPEIGVAHKIDSINGENLYF